VERSVVAEAFGLDFDLPDEAWQEASHLRLDKRQNHLEQGLAKLKKDRSLKKRVPKE
jgi:hypothetical protein